MKLSDTLIATLTPLTVVEEVYKQGYIHGKETNNAQQLWATLLRHGFTADTFWVPKSNPYPSSLVNLDPYLVGLVNCPVNVVPHPRYQPFSLHRHEFYECVVLVAGEAQNMIEGESFRMTAGDVCIIPPYTRHMIGTFQDDGHLLNLVFLDPALVEGLLPPETDYMLLRGLDDSAADFFLEQLIGFSVRLYPPEAESTRLRVLLLEAFLERLRVSVREHPESVRLGNAEYRRPKIMADILYEMQRRYRSLTLQDLSEQFGYTPAHLGRLIRKHTGLTYTDLLRHIRVAQACMYLSDPAIPLDTVPDAVGYAGYAHFSQVFRRIIGQTPAQFRRSAN